MLLSSVYVLVVEQWSSEIPEGLMNNPVYSIDSGDALRETTVRPFLKEEAIRCKM